MIRPFTLLTVFAVASLPWIASAHGVPPAPAHGGRVLEANENWVELVLSGDRVQVYALDETRKPIPAAKLTGTTTVLSHGKPYKVTLTPGAGNELDAGLAVTVGAKDAAVVSLMIGGQRATARYPVGA